MMHNSIRVLLVDDHKVLREGLRALLEGEGDIIVVGEAGTEKEAVESAEVVRPDVVVMDLGLPGGSGLNAIEKIKERCPQSHIVVLSMHCRREIVIKALQAGSDGYVPKSSAHSSLLDAIRVVNGGERYLHPKAATVLVNEITDSPGEAALLSILSDREREVFQLSAMGYTSKEIGDKLVLSPKTVDTYRQRAMDKLNLKHRSEVVRFALRAGIMKE